MKRTKRRTEFRSIITYTLKSFFIKNLITFTALELLYLVVFLFGSLSNSNYRIFYRSYYYVIAPFLEKFLSRAAVDWIFNEEYIIPLLVFAVIFTFNCIAQSVSTLINFNKTYKSLEAITDRRTEIEPFSRSYSDIEIKLKDIKFDVVESRSRAAEAESRKNDLVMYLAHDLKTPLTSVIGYLTLLDESPELSREQRAKFTGIALDKAYRLEQLINEFFEITRFNIHSVTLEKNRIDIGMMLHQLSDEFYPMLSEKQLDINIDLKEKILVFGDSDKLARIFGNLLKNAVAYSYESSVIFVGARIINNRLVIKFRNRCDMIPEAKLARLFEKFYRTDTARMTASGGSGLGLAIAKQLTELHGGAIKAASNESYTEFTVILPYMPCPEAGDAEEEFDS
ncbi:MAG: HAMP domain-containing histidine kinase [Clostridia bacterium]|nr:HAMP domain-containing histidine kinase [Clostridia bacterium]